VPNAGSQATASSEGIQDHAHGHAFRDALRLLFILVKAGNDLTSPHDGWDRVCIGEKRVLAIDFWLRYPDYLADELLDLYEATGDVTALEAAEQIFENDEPDVRIVKMIKWRRGAFDDLQTSLSILRYRGLARSMKRKLPHGFQYEFITGPAARDFIAEALRAQPALAWYDTQTDLALRIAEGKSGTALKGIHYTDEVYAGTPYGAPIPSIRDRVLDRLRSITGEAA
jgi:hypothetical protein